MNRPRRRSGFSLVEMLIVVTILGILSALAIPSTNANLREQLQATAHTLTRDLDYARSLAVTNNSRYRMAIDVAQQRYVLTHTGTNAQLNTLPETPFRDPDDPANEQIVELENLVTGDATGARFLAAGPGGALSGTVTNIEFGPLGEVTSAQEVVVWLVAGAGDGRLYLPIRVDPITGLAWAEDIRDSPPVGAPSE